MFEFNRPEIIRPNLQERYHLQVQCFMPKAQNQREGHHS